MCWQLLPVLGTFLVLISRVVLCLRFRVGVVGYVQRDRRRWAKVPSTDDDTPGFFAMVVHYLHVRRG